MIFTTAGLYTLYLSVSVMVVANLIWLWVLWRTESRGRALLRWGAAQMVVLALFAPWLTYALGYIPTWSSASPVALDVFLRIYWTVLTTGIPVSVESYWWLTVPVLVIFLVGLAALLWTGQRDWQVGRNVALLLMSLLLPAGAVYVVSLPREMFFYSPQLAPRYLLIFAPAFYVLLAWGLARLGEGRLWPRGVPHAQPITPAAATAYLSPIWEEHQGIWLVVTPYAGVNDPQGEIPAWLAARASGVVEHRFADKMLRFYARTEGRAGSINEWRPVSVRPSLWRPIGGLISGWLATSSR